MIDAATQPASVLKVLSLVPTCEDTDAPDIVSYRSQSASDSPFSL